MTTSDGDLVVDRATGAVLSVRDVPDGHEYRTITRFDLPEWRDYLTKEQQLVRATLEDVDICHLGYWMDDAYESPAYAYRDECMARGRATTY